MSATVPQNRCLSWGPETAGYGVAAACTNHLDIAGESLERRPEFAVFRAARHASTDRQIERARSVAGSFDPFLSTAQLAALLPYVVSVPALTVNADGVTLATFVPDPRFTPTSLTVEVPRDIAVHRYTGLFASACRVSFGLGDQHFGVSLTCAGKDEADGGSVLPSVSGAAFAEPLGIGGTPAPAPFMVTLSDGVNSYSTLVESVDLNFGWNRTPRRPERRTTPTGILGGGVTTASGKLKAYYDEETGWILDRLRDQANVRLVLTIQGALLSGSSYETVQITLPVCSVIGKPPTLKGSGFGNIDFNTDLVPLAPTRTSQLYTIAVLYQGIAPDPPVITDVDPADGDDTGGTSVTITGTGFVAGLSVTFGGSSASVDSVTSTEILCTTPPHMAMVVDVVVTNPVGLSDTAAGAFEYLSTGADYGDPIELLLNGGCEDAVVVVGSIQHWTEATGDGWVPRSSSPGPHSGTYYFYAGFSGGHVDGVANSSELRQDVDVSAYATEIDDGTRQFTASGWLRSFLSSPADKARIMVQYRNGGGTVLDTWDTGETTHTTAWVQHSDTRLAPVGTRTIRVRLISRRVSGSSVDGYFDDLSLIFVNPPPP